MHLLNPCCSTHVEYFKYNKAVVINMVEISTIIIGAFLIIVGASFFPPLVPLRNILIKLLEHPLQVVIGNVKLIGTLLSVLVVLYALGFFN